MKIIDTDNFGGDYPDEKVIADNITNKTFGEVMVKALNDYVGEESSRYYQLKEDDYVLQPGFEP
jgi:hypothetical protein